MAGMQTELAARKKELEDTPAAASKENTQENLERIG